MTEQETEKPVFTDKEISSLKDIIDDKALISEEDKKALKKLKGNVSLSDSDLAELFSRCYNLFSLISGSLNEEDEKDFRKQVQEYLQWYDKKTGAGNLSDFVQSLKQADGGFGTMHYGGYLKTKISIYREDYLSFIDLFIQIVDLED